MMSGNLSAASSMTSLNADASPRCATHRKGLKFFCCKHELLLCSVCAVKKHRTCDEVLTINEASEDKRTEGKKILDVYNQRIALVENAIVERKAARKLLDTNAQEIQNEIHQITQRLIDLVKHEERSLLQNLHDMQNKESESLEKDIANLDITCNTIKNLHASLSQHLKLSDIDLIHAVIKEKQQSEDKNNIDSVVKKRFREIDFKFVASPHITSFLRHFKSLGQVMMSEDSSDGQKSTSSISSALTDHSPSSTTSRRVFEFSQAGQQGKTSTQTSSQRYPNKNADEDSHLTARERWARDRQRQTQSSNNQNASQFSQQTPSGLGTQNRPNRTLPRPSTPDLYNRQILAPASRDLTERPMSTPPMEFSLSVYTPNSRNPNNTQVSAYRPKSTVPNSDRTSPRSPTFRQNGSHNANYETHHSHPVHVFQQKDSSEYGMPPDRSRVRSPDHYVANPVVAIKEEDSSYGRSFAAVQITNTSGYGTYEDRNRVRTAKTPSGQNEGRLGYDEDSDNVFAGQPPSYQRTLARRQRVNEHSQSDGGYNRTRSPSDHHGTMATDDDKERRWIHRTAFTSNGIGTKRLLCGIGVLPDGRLILVDQEHYTVQLYDQHQRFIHEIKLDSRPYDVAILGEDRIAVSLQTERTIKFFLVTGDTLTPIAELGVPCEMICYGICRGNGCYCVCCGDEVWILSDEGRVVNQLKHDKAGNSLFVQAEYVTMDTKANNLFVSDAGNNKILAMNIDGRRLWEFTYQGFKPSGIKFVDRYLYICDRDQHRVLMLNNEGHVVKQSVIGRIENPRTLAFNSAGTVLYVTQMRYDAIVSPPRPIQMFSLQ